jgi:hypothetical protein
LVAMLKKAENVEIFDEHTNFSPFKINTDS